MPISNLQRYQRIARLYDVLDLPFERRRYRALRPLLFQGLDGRLLDAGIGTGRNCEFYPPAAIVSGIDNSPAMLARAHDRCPTLAAAGRLYQMDVTALAFPAASFDAAVASFLFCVLPDDRQVPALRGLGRVVKPGGLIRLLEYVRPQGALESGSRGSPGPMARASIAIRKGTLPRRGSNWWKAATSSTTSSSSSPPAFRQTPGSIRSGFLDPDRDWLRPALRKLVDALPIRYQTVIVAC
jgi:ubiquinone/menaquinone biosynthesis C-methylase UbiE